MGRDTKWRPSCSKRALEIKLVFGCFLVFDIATQKFILGKNAKITENEKRMRMRMNKGLTKKLEEKTVDSYSLYVFFFGFYTQQNVNSSPITLTGVMYTLHGIVKNTNCTLKFAFYTSEPHFSVSRSSF